MKRQQQILVGFAPGVDHDQQCGDQRGIHLQGQAVLRFAEQMLALQRDFKPAKKRLHLPAVSVKFHDQFCGQIQPVGHQNPVLLKRFARCGRGMFSAAPFGMKIARGRRDAPRANHAQRLLNTRDGYDLIRLDAGFERLLRQAARLTGLITEILAQPHHEGRACI